MKRFILTGAPGAGKTAVIRQLELDGFSVVEEAATDIIALEQSHAVSEPGSIPRNPPRGPAARSSGRCGSATATARSRPHSTAAPRPGATSAPCPTSRRVRGLSAAFRNPMHLLHREIGHRAGTQDRFGGPGSGCSQHLRRHLCAASGHSAKHGNPAGFYLTKLSFNFFNAMPLRDPQLTFGPSRSYIV
jgi:AAA domain